MRKNIDTTSRDRRHKRIRAKISGTKTRPRLSVYKSNTSITAQLIDDEKNRTLLSSRDKDAKGKTKTERAKEMGRAFAEKAKKEKISTVVFDRGGFKYTGRVKAFAEGAREGGLTF